ncbi:MAG: hypothetical protein ACI8PD_000469 [Nitrospinales bacterium]|jgi:hypothetical protein
MRGNIFYGYTHLIIKKSRCHHCGLIGEIREMHLAINRHLKIGVKNLVIRKKEKIREGSIAK